MYALAQGVVRVIHTAASYISFYHFSSLLHSIAILVFLLPCCCCIFCWNNLETSSNCTVVKITRTGTAEQGEKWEG